MPLITSGANATIAVAANQILTVIAHGGEYTFENPVGTRIVDSGSSNVFGPFPAAASVKLTSIQGDLYYELAAATVTGIVSAATSTALGGVKIGSGLTIASDGTIASTVQFSSDAAGNILGIQGAGGVLPLQDAIFNFKRSNYAKTRKGLAQVRISAANMPVLCIGDSTTLGQDGATAANSVSRSWVTKLASRLSGQGLSTGSQNVLGEHQAASAISSSIAVVDPRMTALPTNWVLANAALFGTTDGGMAGSAFQNGTDQTPLTFTPNTATDTLDVFYYDAGGPAILVKGGATGTTVSNGGGVITVGNTNRMKRATVVCPGTSVWTIQNNTTAGSIFIQGFSAYLSTTSEVSLYNVSASGKKVSYFAGSTANFFPFQNLTTPNVVAGYAPLAIINIGINDFNAATNVTTFQTTLNTLVTALQSAGTEVLLIAPTPCTVGAASQVPYNAAIYTVALANNCAVIDLYQRWVSVASSNALGYYGDSGTHPSIMGYTDIASAVSQFFSSI